MDGQLEDPVDRAIDRWVNTDVDTDTCEERVGDYRKYTVKKILFIIACIVGAVLLADYSLVATVPTISVSEALDVIWNHLFGTPDTDSSVDYIIWILKTPTVVIGILAGIGLAVAGTVMQSILRNPLADPYTTGISSGASLGVAISFAFGLSFIGPWTQVFLAFIFSLVPMAFIVAVSKARGASPTTMIMAGLAIMYIFNAITTIIKLWTDPDTLAALYSWSVGTLDVIATGSRPWESIEVMFIFVLLGSIAMMALSRKLNVIATGDESARSMGVNPERYRIIALLLVSLLTAGVVSFTGLIGFVGLVAPHICRLVVGSDNRYLIPASMAFGALLLTVADVIGKTIIYPHVIQVGVITAFIGGPLFLYLIVKQRRNLA